jgi:hypothetical protein
MLNFLFGDARFFWTETLRLLLHVPSSWDSSLNTGLGIPALNTMWITSYLHLSIFLGSILRLDWQVTNTIFWVLPAIILSFFSSYILFKELFPEKKLYGILAGIIYLSNTYFSMIFLGGQQGVALAYSIMPILLWGFIKFHNKPSVYRALCFGLLVSLQILFDPRIFFLSAIMFGLYVIVLFDAKKLREVLRYSPIVLIVVFLLHFFWIVPLLIFKFSQSVGSFGVSPSAKYFSFAQFEDTISLLHPNFPENIFGKVYFLKSEFLLIPILAFVGLLYIAKEKIQKKKVVLFLVMISLFGAFLAKGTNEPFGVAYKFLFDYVPGFSLFRDPTKFYLFVSLAYSMLIPFSLFSLAEKMKKKLKGIHVVLGVLFIFFWVFSLRYLSVQNFAPKKVPEGYVELTNFITSQNSYFRTLWIPQWQRYGYFSDQNPAIGRFEFLKAKTPLGMVKELQKEEMEAYLQEASIKYVIVPEDSVGEIFLTDRKYDDALYVKTVSEISKIAWLSKAQTYGKNVVFKVTNPRSHFFSNNENLSVSFKMESSTRYLVNVANAQVGDRIIFSESFDRNWKLQNADSSILESQKYKMFNSFILSKSGTYSVHVFYAPQKIVNIGIFVSITSFVSVFALLFYLKKYRRSE